MYRGWTKGLDEEVKEYELKKEKERVGRGCK